MIQVEFGSLFQFIRNGMNIKQDKFSGGLPITRIETISEASVDPRKVGFAGLDENRCKSWLLEEGDVLFSHINSVEHVGKCAVYEGNPKKLVHGMNLLCLRCNQEKLVPDFAKYLIRSKSFRIKLSAYINKAVNQASVSIGHLRTILVEVPAVSEQRNIAAILDKADNLRRKRQEAIQLADDFLRAVFLDMFGDPVTNPKGWPTESIEELCHIATGATPSRDVPSYFVGTHPWIKTGEVDSEWIQSAEESISDRAILETNCKLFPPKTILVAMYGQGKTRGKVGMLGIHAATNQACAAILPSDKVAHHFLFMQLRMSYEALRDMGRGGNQENLNLGMIRSLRVLRPPGEIVERFLAVRERIIRLCAPMSDSNSDNSSLLCALQERFY